MTQNIFDAYGAYYDALYLDKNYANESTYVINILRKHCSSVRNILEFGSGTGVHGHELASQGFDVHGIELSPVMVERARQHPHFSCEVGDARLVNLHRQFDAVMSLFHVFSYQCKNSDALAVMRSASRHLGKGGLFYFDFWYTPAVLSLRPTVKIKEIDLNEASVVRIASPVMRWQENVVDVNFKVVVTEKPSMVSSVIRELHSMRHFSLPEIDLLCEITGFRRIHAAELITDNKPSESTWAIGVLLEKV
jgi:SAM-dependent methyltransferase